MDIFVAALGLFVILVVAFNEFYQQKLGVSPMPTMPRVRRRMIGLIPDNIKDHSGTQILEIGSGWGKLSREMARAYPNSAVVAFERSLFPYLFSRLYLFFSRIKNLTIMRRDFMAHDFSDTDIVLCYLSNPHMAALEPKLDTEMAKGSHVISSTFYMPNREADHIETVKGLYDTKIYCYKN